MLRRTTVKGLNCIVGYHTQESRTVVLTQPKMCVSNEAWLGIGFYFWTHLEFAHYWGNDGKKFRTGGTIILYK